MDIIQWATDPWGQNVPIHIAWFLIWVAAIGGLLFLMIHAITCGISQKPGTSLMMIRVALHPPCRSKSPDTHWAPEYFTGSWRPRCSRFYSQRFCPGWESSLTG